MMLGPYPHPLDLLGIAAGLRLAWERGEPGPWRFDMPRVWWVHESIRLHAGLWPLLGVLLLAVALTRL